jgi:flagellum-specific ATP synthase
MGIFAGSGVGKSTLMAMLVRNTNADVAVVGLVGERGREVQDFIQDDLGPEGMARAVVVVATGDEPPLMRRQAAWTATAVAEHFRDEGKQVLLLIDSVTRFAMAQREIGLSGGEPPTSKGYPPTVFSELPHLLERAGPGPQDAGDITGLYTVLVDGDDLNDPIADSVRGILDGHVVLDRRIAEQDRYPAVNVQKSISRMLPDCHGDGEFSIMQAARRALGKYADMEDLIRVGAYRAGADPEVDAAIRFFGPATRFLSQRKGEATPPGAAFGELRRLLTEAGIEISGGT